MDSQGNSLYGLAFIFT